MIGIVITGHGNVALGLLATTEMIVGPQENLVAVAFEGDVELQKYRESVDAAAKSVDSGDGVIFLGDLQGGTPCNVAAIIAYEKNYRVVSGVNVPMLVETVMAREGLDIDAAVEIALAAGKDGIGAVRIEI